MLLTRPHGRALVGAAISFPAPLCVTPAVEHLVGLLGGAWVTMQNPFLWGVSDESRCGAQGAPAFCSVSLEQMLPPGHAGSPGLASSFRRGPPLSSEVDSTARRETAVLDLGGIAQLRPVLVNRSHFRQCVVRRGLRV